MVEGEAAGERPSQAEERGCGHGPRGGGGGEALVDDGRDDVGDQPLVEAADQDRGQHDHPERTIAPDLRGRHPLQHRGLAGGRVRRGTRAAPWGPGARLGDHEIDDRDHAEHDEPERDIGPPPAEVGDQGAGQHRQDRQGHRRLRPEQRQRLAPVAGEQRAYHLGVADAAGPEGPQQRVGAVEPPQLGVLERQQDHGRAAADRARQQDRAHADPVGHPSEHQGGDRAEDEHEGAGERIVGPRPAEVPDHRQHHERAGGGLDERHEGRTQQARQADDHLASGEVGLLRRLGLRRFGRHLI